MHIPGSVISLCPDDPVPAGLTAAVDANDNVSYIPLDRETLRRKNEPVHPEKDEAADEVGDHRCHDLVDRREDIEDAGKNRR